MKTIVRDDEGEDEGDADAKMRKDDVLPIDSSCLWLLSFQIY